MNNNEKTTDGFDSGDYAAKRSTSTGSLAEESLERTAGSYIAKRASSQGNLAPIKKTQGSSQGTEKKTVAFSRSDYLDYAGYKRRKPKSEKKFNTKTVVRRFFIVLASVLLFAIIAVYALCFTLAKGPSETVRNLLVLSAKQASATKWVPSLFLDGDTIAEILADSEKVNTDVISIDEYMSSDSDTESADEWADAKDGMIFKKFKGSTYTAYILIVKDPSRVFTGVSSDNFSSSTAGSTIFDAAERNSAVAAINAGEFADPGGVGTGARPIGLTYSRGECVWNDGLKRTFIGFDQNDRLVVRESMTKAEADELGIRDAVSFQTGNVLISSDGDNVTVYYADGNTGTAQRTAIGQRADGAVILLVTDGRTASSLGATHNDVIDIMKEYGAINAAMLDGGSSAMMYYENYYEKYDSIFDYDSLDQYQKKGLINKYKAFTTPRRMPTFFMVSPEGGTND
ncbi:MAG: phosphodiester glycosidase family protein [Eubacteriales bacterium]